MESTFFQAIVLATMFVIVGMVLGFVIRLLLEGNSVRSLPKAFVLALFNLAD